MKELQLHNNEFWDDYYITTVIKTQDEIQKQLGR